MTPPSAITKLLPEAARYATAGFVGAAADVGAYAIMVHGLAIPPLVANLISRPAGGLVSFAFNKFWTFKGRSPHGTGTQLFRFCIVWSACFAVSEALVWLLHDMLGFDPLLTKIGAEAPATLFSYLAQRYWTFA